MTLPRPRPLSRRSPPGRHPAADAGPPIDWRAARRVLAVRPDNLGDVVMLTPALRALRVAAPGAQLELLTSPAGSALRPLVRELDGQFVISPSWQQVDVARRDDRHAAAREHALIDLLRVRRYDVMVVFTSFSQSPWPAAYAGLLAEIGTRIVHSGEFGGSVATHWVTPPPDTTHQVDRCLHLLAAVGVPIPDGPDARAPRLHLPPDAAAAAEQVLAAAGDPDPFALLVPGASCPARRYDRRRFAAAAARIAAAGLPVLVSGTPEEQGLVTEVVEMAKHPGVRVLPPLPLPTFAAVVARAAVALTNNSGGMHVADALGTPVVVTYAGTERLGDMRPRSVPAVLLQHATPCSPCRQFRCPYRRECLDVLPDRLAAAALELAGGLTTRTETECHTAQCHPEPSTARR